MSRTVAISALAVLLAACSSKPSSGFGDAGPNGGGDSGTVGDDGGGLSQDDGGFNFGDAQTGDGAVPTCNPSPGNYDIPGNNCDDDGDGQTDNAPNCDTNLPATGDAMAFAKAIGLCQTASGPNDTKWGVISAVYANGYQSNAAPVAAQHGILKKFGNKLKARQGGQFGVLSSGYAQEYDQCYGQGPFKGGCGMGGSSAGAPPGYPKAAGSCTVSNVVNDVATVRLKIKVPNNAKGIGFDFNFGSGEWPEFVCTTFNDSYIAWYQSSAFNGGKPENISYQLVGKQQYPINVNSGFFDRCSPSSGLGGCQLPSQYCAGGDSELQGTGFYNPGSHCGGATDSGGGMTGWLTTQAPAKPGEVITIEFMVWDTGDDIYDSSVLIDNWQWQAGDTTVGTVRPPN